MDIDVLKKQINEKIEDRTSFMPIKLGLEKRADLLERYSFSFYGEVGTLNLNLDQNATIYAKQMFYKNLRGIEFDYWLNMGLYPEFKAKKKDYLFFSNIIMHFENIFLCDHEEGIQYLFKEALEFHKNDKLNSKWQKPLFPFLYLMNNDRQKAKDMMQMEYKKADSYSKGIAYVTAGILYDDISLVNKGIAYQINYGGGHTGPEANYHNRATGLAKIALRFGIEPDLSDSRINKKMLEYEKVDYEDIDNMFEALGVEPIMRHKLRNY
jgi:hypothetical protein